MQALASVPSFSRREMLRNSCAGFGYLALQGLLGLEAAQGAVIDPLAAKRSHFPARAKRVIGSVDVVMRLLLVAGTVSRVPTAIRHESHRMGGRYG